MRNTFIQSLIEHAEHNPKIWLLTADLGYSVVEKFAEKFPDRFLNVGVAEQNMISVAAGISSMGYTVVVYSIINFLILRALEQIRIDVCYHKFDVKLVGVGAGYAYGSAGYTHHSLEDIAALRSFPYLKIFSPADPFETSQCMNLMLNTKGPAYLRIGKGKSDVLHKILPIFQEGDIVFLEEGSDIALISTGSVLKIALDAALLLKQEGFSVSIISCPCLKPLKKESVFHVASKVKCIVSLEAHGAGGLSSILAEILLQYDHKVFYKGLNCDGDPLAVCGNEDELNELKGLSSLNVAETAMALFKKSMSFQYL